MFPCRVSSISTSHLRITRKFQPWTLCIANTWRMRENPGTSFHHILALSFVCGEMNLQDAVVWVKYAWLHGLKPMRLQQRSRWKGKLSEGHVWLWVNVCVAMQVQDHWHHRKRRRAGCGESERVWNDCWRILSGLWGDHHHEPGKTEVGTLVYKKTHTCIHISLLLSQYLLYTKRWLACIQLLYT